MEEFIQKILLLDKKTKELAQSSELELAKQKAETMDFLNSFEVKGHEEAKKKAQESFEKAYQEARVQAQEIHRENLAEVESLDQYYNRNKERLVDQAFILLGLGKED